MDADAPIPAKRTRWVAGWTNFAAIIMSLIGGFGILQGLAAIIKDDFFVVSSQYVYRLDANAWGWINLIIGAMVLLAGLFLFSDAGWARFVAVVAAVVAAIDNFMWLPYYPLWSIISIALCVIVIFALTAHRDDEFA
jgi:hypothetical protein